MKCSLSRTLTVAAIAALGSVAVAENYTAFLYGTPGGYQHVQITGAGDNGLMSGVLYSNAEPAGKAFYMTNSGYKLMHPDGWGDSFILDSWGATYHCGHGSPTPTAANRALFWVGGGPAVDIHPAGAEYLGSACNGGGGQLQVGAVAGIDMPCEVCGPTPTFHAGVWSRTAASFRRLHAPTHKDTLAQATDGTKIVGYGTHRIDGSRNAILWNSPTSNGVNIRPSLSTSSQALSVWGNQQGGFYVSPVNGGEDHACIWAGTAASVVDLNPNSVFRSSRIAAVRNGLQVGHGYPITQPGRPQAIAWHGNAATWINLHARLPIAFQTWRSYATGIDNLGNVVGIVSRENGTESRPVIWIRS